MLQRKIHNSMESVFTSWQEIDTAVKHLYTLYLVLAKALPYSDQDFTDTQPFWKNGHSSRQVHTEFCPRRIPRETRNGGTQALPFCHMYRAKPMAFGDYWHTKSTYLALS
jgi:hypothetical protein